MEQLPKSYDAKSTDSKWYQFWDEKGYFKADPHSSKPPYCIVIPPPNVTGVLHMGHALVNTLQDILIRWKRMLGFEALWVPGTDHAGIATQTVVERHLIQTEGKKRKDYSREDFLKHVWAWKEKSETSILGQLKRLGSSCDWTRLRFTMDENNSRAVRTMFKKLFDEGLIYRGDYLVNWDPVTQTALADDEVDYEDRQSFLWHFKYPLANGEGFIHIATTRPETMLGDTAIAVSPGDQRYASLIGQNVLLPLMDRLIPIIADHHVDPDFGTGMVKVTPAHDPNDYQMGHTHGLPFINIMTPDGKINENGGKFAGLSMAEARDAVVSAMKEKGLIEKIEPHSNRVGVSYRSNAVIEPYLSKQWFIRMDGFAKELQKTVKTGEVKLLPSHWDNTYFHWIDNLRDWCISRQLWWGHRIPIWYHKEDPERIICYEGADIPE
jgi:valyl-tRNA synthetase